MNPACETKAAPVDVTPSEAKCLQAIADAGSAVMAWRGGHIRLVARGEWLPFKEATPLALLGRHLLEVTRPQRLEPTAAGFAALHAWGKPRPPRGKHSRARSALRTELEAIKPGATWRLEVPRGEGDRATAARVAATIRTAWGAGNASVKRDPETGTITAKRLR